MPSAFESFNGAVVLTGDFKRLKRLIRLLNKAEVQHAYEHAMGLAAPEMAALAHEQIVQRMGPSGRPWKPTKKGQPASEDIYGSVIASPKLNGLEMHASAPWAKAHQGGSRHVMARIAGKVSRLNKKAIKFAARAGVIVSRGKTPARPLFPTKSLPDRYLRPISSILIELWYSKFKGLAD
jgi:hypothetical protein